MNALQRSSTIEVSCSVYIECLQSADHELSIFLCLLHYFVLDTGILSSFMLKLDMKLDSLMEQHAETLTLLRSLVASGSSADAVDDMFTARMTTIEELDDLERMLEESDYRKKMVCKGINLN
jgi:hypothetical protein